MAAPPLAYAQDEAASDSEASPDERARRAFENGAAHYEAGRFDEAEAEFQVAYRLTGRIELLYNIYLARRDGGHLEGARDALREFVTRRELPPDAPQARRLAALEARLESSGSSSESDPDESTETSSVSTEVLPTSSSDDSGGGGVSIPGVILLAAGGAVLIGGAALVGVAYADEAAIESPEGMPVWTEDTQAAADRVPVLAGAGGAMLGVGLAAVGVGVVLMVIDSGSSDAQAMIRDGRWEVRF